MSWEIRANLGRYARGGADAHGWRWEITRGAQVAQVVIEISGTAWSSDPLHLPEDTRGALQTDGRTELLKVLDQDDPPPRHPVRLFRLLVPVCRRSGLGGLAEGDHVGLDAGARKVISKVRSVIEPGWRSS